MFLLSQLMNDKGVYRTAPATTGLLISNTVQRTAPATPGLLKSNIKIQSSTINGQHFSCQTLFKVEVSLLWEYL